MSPACVQAKRISRVPRFQWEVPGVDRVVGGQRERLGAQDAVVDPQPHVERPARGLLGGERHAPRRAQPAGPARQGCPGRRRYVHRRGHAEKYGSRRSGDRFHVPGQAHRPGQIARIAEAIADAEGLIGDINTVNLTRRQSIREITVECRDREHANQIAEKLADTDGVTLLWCRDRALMKHEGGKLVIEPVREVETVQEMRDVYTPGVAQACRAIADDPRKATDYTMIGRTVAICTNGTRVLGLGDIGPLASMPVMEGKAVFYRQFAGISAMPILIDTHDAEEFVETVDADLADLRRNPPGGHRLAGLLRDRGAADRGARHAGDARRRPRHGGGHAGRRARRLPARGQGLREDDRRPDRPGGGRLRDRVADAGGRGRAGPGQRPQRGISRARARRRHRDRELRGR